MKYRDNNQPRQLFLDTVVEFYEKLGSREFWGDDKKQTIALEALSQDYIRTDHTGFEEEDSTTLEATINEYNLRKKYMLGVSNGSK